AVDTTPFEVLAGVRVLGLDHVGHRPHRLEIGRAHLTERLFEQLRALLLPPVQLTDVEREPFELLAKRLRRGDPERTERVGRHFRRIGPHTHVTRPSSPPRRAARSRRTAWS